MISPLLNEELVLIYDEKDQDHSLKFVPLNSLDLNNLEYLTHDFTNFISVKWILTRNILGIVISNSSQDYCVLHNDPLEI